MRHLRAYPLRTVSLLLTLSLAAASQTPLLSTSSTIDNAVRDHMRSGQIPGAAVAVLHHGRVMTLGTYGHANVELRAPISEHSVFELASLTKQMTAVAILLLKREHKLRLEDPVTTYIDDSPAHWKGITIQHLLCHMAGLVHHFEQTVNGSHLLDYSTADMMRSAKAAPLLFTPGSDWQYSDLGYFLLGAIIERITGASYESFLRERFFKPLGMSETYLLDQARIIPNRVAGYSIKDGELQNNRRAWQFGLLSHFGVMSSMTDMARWEQGLVSEQVVPRGVQDEMWTISREFYEDPSKQLRVGYGFGWWVQRKGRELFVEHGGATGTYYFRDVRNELAVIVLTNRDYSSGTKPSVLARKLARIVNPAAELDWLMPL